ncbi:hypothetical protein PVAP13_7NG041134 [Panicum virgatum]|uniref:Uncharacterized protein n=1 Tax=Panicum virgatum TaxID=38727 RepID=A0A8T0Q2V5_PANVG|nr:hypothetical protein PVAP13_7NG041134 [Panicum virgatum]
MAGHRPDGCDSVGSAAGGGRELGTRPDWCDGISPVRRTGHEPMKPLPPLTQTRPRRAAPPPSPADAISARCTHPCGRCAAAAWQPHAAPSPAPPRCARLRATADRPARGARSASAQPRPRPLRLAAPASAPPRPRPLHPPAATRSHYPRGSGVVAAPRRGPSRGGRRGARWGMGSEEGRRSETDSVT